MNQPIDSYQLRAFAVLARTGSFTQAARELFVTQSGVSHAMKALERDIGCRLLDRLGRKVVLTEAGEALLRRANRIGDEMQAARDELAQLGRWGHGRLRIGASATACQYLLPAVLREFKESFPHCQIIIAPGDAAESLQAVADRRVDLAVSLSPGPADDLEFIPLFEDELVFAMSPLHPWAQAGRVVREEIPRQNLVVYRKGSQTWRMTVDYFAQEDMVLNTVIELGSMEAIKELLKVGLGIGVMAPWVMAKELQDGSLVALPLGRRKLRREWGLVHWQGRRLTLAEETFAGLCRDACQGHRFRQELAPA